MVLLDSSITKLSSLILVVKTCSPIELRRILTELNKAKQAYRTLLIRVQELEGKVEEPRFVDSRLVVAANHCHKNWSLEVGPGSVSGLKDEQEWMEN